MEAICPARGPATEVGGARTRLPGAALPSWAALLAWRSSSVTDLDRGRIHASMSKIIAPGRTSGWRVPQAETTPSALHRLKMTDRPWVKCVKPWAVEMPPHRGLPAPQSCRHSLHYRNVRDLTQSLKNPYRLTPAATLCFTGTWFIYTETYFSVHGLTQANAPGACRLLQPGGQRYALFVSSGARSQTCMGRTWRFSKRRARLTPGSGRNNPEAGKPQARLHADHHCTIRVHPRLSAS
jgi:hypothetical protein